MKRTFSFAEARELLQKHESWETERGTLSRKAEDCRAVVEAACEHFVAAETMKTLRDIPVEELNRERRGLRVRLLRESGYADYADLMLASEEQLAALNGISEDGAALIKDAVGETVTQLRPGIKLRLSADKRTEETSNIVLALYRYRSAEGLSRDAQALSSRYAAGIEKAMEELSRGKGFFRWLFTGKAEKDAASEAFLYLENLANGAYRAELTRLHEVRVELEASSAETAWDYFRTQPIVYSNLLEKLVPGLLGNGDAVYGLPEELAREVEAEPLFADGMRCELRRYQAWGVKYILHQGKVLLGDEMGLGKTVQAIAAMVTLRNTGATHFAVVCPASVLVNWCREISKFSDLKAIKVHGSLKQAALSDWITSGGVAVTSYETVQHWELPEDFGFSLLTVDEAHYIKNPGARRTVHVRNLALRAERLLFMTGTALENRVDEMVELMRKANGVGLAANQVDIAKRFFVLEVEGNVKKVINPEILESGEEMAEFEEGCLSIPGVFKKVTRPEKIKVKYLDENGEEKIEELTEMWSRAFQHELDHLDGVLFTDRISVLNKRLVAKKLEVLKKDYNKGKIYREDI